MKKILFGLSFVAAALFGGSAIAQEVNTGTQTDGAALTVDKEVHDYGTIKQGDNGVCVFTITNTGNQPLIISECKGSCGCTVPTWPRDPIAPGATAEIQVKYDTNRVGPINKSVTITSNAVNEPSKTVRIRGNITAKPAEGTN